MRCKLHNCSGPILLGCIPEGALRRPLEPLSCGSVCFVHSCLCHLSLTHLHRLCTPPQGLGFSQTIKMSPFLKPALPCPPQPKGTTSPSLNPCSPHRLSRSLGLQVSSLLGVELRPHPPKRNLKVLATLPHL